MNWLRTTLALMMAATALAMIPVEATATVPGEIGRIVFSSDADHISSEIYVRDFASSSPIRLTTNAAFDYGAKWSPDGSLIAFSRSLPKSPTHVYVMSPDGSGQTNLTSSTGEYNAVLDWSPDGTQILFSSNRGGVNDLWVMRQDGSNPQQLTDTASNEPTASWSPDGSTIVFGRNNDIWVMNADGTNERTLLARTAPDSAPVWSPDGAKIAFVSWAAGVDDIWVMNPDGSQPINLTGGGMGEAYLPAWSPDGTKIAYTSDADGDADIWMMNPDGTGQVHLTDHPANEYDVSWESVNRAPLAVDDEATTYRGLTVEIDLLKNDSDPDGEAITLADITRMPEQGSATIGANGIVTYVHSGVTMPRGHVLPYTDSFEYRVEDERLGSSTATVEVWIYPYFDDTPQSNVFFEDIGWLAIQDVTRGCNPPANTLFCPESFVTRGQMAAFLVRTRQYTDIGTGDLFVDDNGSVFEADIDKLGTARVTRGCNPPVNDRYCPDALVTRGQMAAFLSRAFSLTAGGKSDLFVDDNESPFEADIDKLGATGVSKGCNPPTNNRFCPDDFVTRQQMAAFIKRAVGWGGD